MSWDWPYIAIVLFVAAICVTIGWYVASKRRLPPDVDNASLKSKAFGALILLLAMASIGEGVYFQHKQESSLECQYKVNSALIEVLTTRTNASKTSNEKLVETFKAILRLESPEERRQAIQDFIDEMDRLKATQEANPIPKIPNDCKP